MGIVEFLEAQIAEDEAVAKAASAESGGSDWAVRDIPWEGIYHFATSDDPPGEVTAVTHHMDIHDPARVLREVAAKRALLEFWRRIAEPAWMNEPWSAKAWYEMRNGAILPFAAAYSDHPDFNEEWVL